MIEVLKLSDMKGAEKYGTCTSCHKNPDESELYRIKIGGDGLTSSVCLCRDCIQLLYVKMQRAWEQDKIERRGEDDK